MSNNLEGIECGCMIFAALVGSGIGYALVVWANQGFPGFAK